MNWRLDLNYGRLENNRNGVIVLPKDLHNLSTEWEKLGSVEIIAPEDHSEIDERWINQVTKSFLDSVRECIPHNISELRLENPTEILLERINFHSDLKTNIKKLTVINPSKEFEWEGSYMHLPELNYLSCPAEWLKYFSQNKHVHELHLNTALPREEMKLIDTLFQHNEKPKRVYLQINAKTNSIAAVIRHFAKYGDKLAFLKGVMSKGTAQAEFCYDKDSDTFQGSPAYAVELAIDKFKFNHLDCVCDEHEVDRIRNILEEEEFEKVSVNFTKRADAVSFIEKPIEQKKIGLSLLHRGNKYEQYAEKSIEQHVVNEDHFFDETSGNVESMKVHFHSQNHELRDEICKKIASLKLKKLYIGANNGLLTSLLLNKSCTSSLGELSVSLDSFKSAVNEELQASKSDEVKIFTLPTLDSLIIRNYGSCSEAPRLISEFKKLQEGSEQSPRIASDWSFEQIDSRDGFSCSIRCTKSKSE